MQLAFNELSFRPHRENHQQLWVTFEALLKTFKAAQKEHGFDHILFPAGLGTLNVLQGISFYEWLGSLDPGHRNKIAAMVRTPFSPTVLEEQEGDVDAFYYNADEIGINEEDCQGLGVASILDLPSISLNSHTHWQRTTLTCFRMNEAAGVAAEPVNVENICVETDVNGDSFVHMVERICVVEPQETRLTYEEKTIDLRDDHGNDVLEAFSRRLLRSPLAEHVINSLPFNPRTRRFIRRCYPNGTVELVLHWTGPGLGIVVQTTGRNLRETEAIAQILEADYGR